MILTATENGYGKLTPIDEFPVHGRGGQGVIAMQTSERNGRLVAAMQVATTTSSCYQSSGTLVRTRAEEISVLGRNTQGVRLIRLDEGERLVGVERVEPVSTRRGGEWRKVPPRMQPGRPSAAADRL